MEFMIGGGIFLVMVIFFYNRLIGKKNEIQNAQGGLDTYLKQRFDLIPNLAQAVKAYMAHEASVLERIVELRNGSNQANLSMEEKSKIHTDLSHGLSKLFVQVENYPDLKSSANFLDLQNSMKEVEEHIAASRRFFNAAVVDYNNSLEMFPSNLMGKIMGLKTEAVFNIPEVEKQNVNIQNIFSQKAS